MYIYKLGTECDGAQTQASVVYIPTLVALLGLCFDPSECFQDLHIWSGVMGNKSGKLRCVSQIMTGSRKTIEYIISQSLIIQAYRTCIEDIEDDYHMSQGCPCPCLALQVEPLKNQVSDRGGDM